MRFHQVLSAGFGDTFTGLTEAFRYTVYGGSREVRTMVATGANSDTQELTDASGIAVDDRLFFALARVYAVVTDVTGNTVTLDASVSSVSHETVAKEVVALDRTNDGVAERLDGGIATGTYDFAAIFDSSWLQARVVSDFEGDQYDGILDEQIYNLSLGSSGIPSAFPSVGSLTPRQVAFYKQKMDIWRLPERAAGPVAKTLADNKVYVRIYAAAPSRDQTTRYNSTISELGRGDDPNFLTRNDRHTTIDLSEWKTEDHFGRNFLQDGDVVMNVNDGDDPAINGFVCVGEGEKRAGRANYQHVDTQRFVIRGTNIEAFYL